MTLVALALVAFGLGSGGLLSPSVAAHVAAEHTEAAAALNPADELVSADGSLRVSLGVYSDCSGQAPVPRDIADYNVCYGRTYFIGHNPGVFTPLMHMQVGDRITWYDPSRTAHQLRIAGVRVVSRYGGVPQPLNAGVVAQFQTCEVLDGSWDRILDATEA